MFQPQLILTLALILNAANVLIILLCVIITKIKGAVGNMVKFSPYRYFTVDSNILVALSSLAAIPFLFSALRTGTPLPEWVTLLRFVGTVAVSVTMFTVLVFLGPRKGYGPLLANQNLYLHLICPLLAEISFIFLENITPMSFSQIWWGMLPTILYGIVYFILVIVTKIWEDLYGFNKNKRWWLSVVLMLAGTFAISALLWLAQRGLTLIH